MRIKSHPAMNILYSTFTVSLRTIHDKIGTVARDLHQEAARQHLLVTGPVYWFYTGSDGMPDTMFTLDIAIPVSGTPDTCEQFKFLELPPFRCVSVLHEGCWSTFSDSYSRLISHVAAENYNMTGVCREMYINIDFSREECNLTEIQVGIK